jgi:hypothetical protein
LPSQVGGVVLGFQTLWNLRNQLISAPVLGTVFMIYCIALYFSPRYRQDLVDCLMCR